ncbi:MAG: hypothetical protein C0412_00325 [Flavobacterium sp.]|nr:hypothetical protein [Flavobacterium sp.]
MIRLSDNSDNRNTKKKIKTMKNTLLKYSLSVFFLCINFATFAAQPGSGSDTGNLETEDAPAAPIDDCLWILVLLGILLAVYTFRNNWKKA